MPKSWERLTWPSANVGSWSFVLGQCRVKFDSEQTLPRHWPVNVFTAMGSCRVRFIGSHDKGEWFIYQTSCILNECLVKCRDVLTCSSENTQNWPNLGQKMLYGCWWNVKTIWQVHSTIYKIKLASFSLTFTQQFVWPKFCQFCVLSLNINETFLIFTSAQKLKVNNIFGEKITILLIIWNFRLFTVYSYTWK